jgi:hypothetical protein
VPGRAIPIFVLSCSGYAYVYSTLEQLDGGGTKSWNVRFAQAFNDRKLELVTIN